MSNARDGIRKRWIPVVVVLTIMVGASSFAIVPNTAQPTVAELAKKAILLGNAGSSTGATIITTNIFMWTEDCAITPDPPAVFSSIDTECTKHTLVTKIVGTKGDREEFTITGLRCLAANPDQLAIIRGNVGSGVLLDIDEASVGLTNVRLTTRPNEWVVQVPDCVPDTLAAGNINEFHFDLVLLKSGSFEFDFSIEELE